MTDNEPLNTDQGSWRDELASALAELLSKGEFPVLRAVLGLGPSEALDLRAGYTVPDLAYAFLRAVFSTYRLGEDGHSFATPLDLITAPDREQVEAAIRTLVLYQPPHVPDMTTFEEFVFLYQMVATVYRKPEDLPRINVFLMARVRMPDKYFFYFDFLVGRREGPGWTGFERDVHDLIRAASWEEAGVRQGGRLGSSRGEGDIEMGPSVDPEGGLASQTDALVSALKDLLEAGDFPVVRQTLGLGTSGRFDPDHAYVLPDSAYEFLRTVFSTYRFDDDNLRLFSPFEVVATPTRAELETAVRTLVLHQPPHSHEATSFEEFMFRFHVFSKKFREPDGIGKILDVLDGGVRDPVGHSMLFRLLRGFGEEAKWKGFNEDLRDLVTVASHRERPN